MNPLALLEHKRADGALDEVRRQANGEQWKNAQIRKPAQTVGQRDAACPDKATVEQEGHQRLPAGARDRVTSLNDVSMYNNDEDQPFMNIFQSISDREGGKETAVDYKKASKSELADFMTAVLPDWDRDRVHDSDIRKLIQWYNILVRGGYTQFVEPAEAAEAETEAEAATEA